MKYVVRVGDQQLELQLDGESVVEEGELFEARLDVIEGTPVRLLRIGDAVHRVLLKRRSGRGEYELWIDGFRYHVEALDERTHAIRQLSGADAGPAGPAPLVAPMPGLIVRVAVEPGTQVQPGQGLVVMEAMKMENELRAATAGRVKRVLVKPGEAVEKGATLVELE